MEQVVFWLDVEHFKHFEGDACDVKIFAHHISKDCSSVSLFLYSTHVFIRVYQSEAASVNVCAVLVYS